MGTSNAVASTASHQRPRTAERIGRRGAPASAPDGSVMRASAPTARSAPARPAPTGLRGAVIIPAHDEAAVIGRTLAALAPLAATARTGSGPGQPRLEIIVACNGCADDTAAVARRFAGVTVVETAEASKPAGLNLGDAVATQWPRLYLDADIDITPAAVADVLAELARPGVLAARPRFVYDTSEATLPVRAYYRARARIPAPARRLWGAGGYAASAAGHERFGAFAAVTADDSWFDAQFDDAEKRVVDTDPMRVRTPRDCAALLAVLARQRRGYLELGVAPQTQRRGAALLTSVRSPEAAIDALWYLLLTLASRRRARARMRVGARGGAAAVRWERDGSTRERAAVAR